jgi:hypothetical protein
MIATLSRLLGGIDRTGPVEPVECDWVGHGPTGGDLEVDVRAPDVVVEVDELGCGDLPLAQPLEAVLESAMLKSELLSWPVTLALGCPAHAFPRCSREGWVRG